MSTAAGILDAQPSEKRPMVPGSLSGLADLRHVAVSLRQMTVAEWVTFLLVGVMLGAVGWSVQLARWGELPSILPTMAIAWVAALVASRLSTPWPVKIVIAVTLGFAVLMWQGTLESDGLNAAERARDGWERFWVWIRVAREGGISTDAVPFSLLFMTMSWITGYTVTALTLRIRNPWIPTILLAVGLMSNLSFRPGLHEHTFYIFILATVALFAHLATARRIRSWRASGITPPASLQWMPVRDGLLFGGVLIAVAAILPLWEVRSSAIDGVWEVFKSPINALQEPASRLLAGVKGGERGGHLRTPGEVLPFRGPIELTPEPIMWLTSPYQTMLPGRVYQEYTSSGWLVGPRSVASVEPRTQLLPVPEDLERERIDQVVQPLFDTKLVLPMGEIFGVDRGVRVEYLNPVRHVVPLTGPVAPIAALPPDLRDFAFDLRFALRDAASPDPGSAGVTLNGQARVDTETVTRILTELLPVGVSARVIPGGAGAPADTVVLARAAPPEQVGVELTETISAEKVFTVTTYVPLASDEELSLAGDDYPSWITDRYLQLPDSLPLQVRRLAREIVLAADAETGYEKARAVQSFLQQQVYSQEISGPAANTDGVFYFLFETQNEPCPSTIPDCDLGRIKGYSQYFGSAATVLLRSVGVPSRMVAGWAAGEFIPAAGKFLIRDEDRHGWSQVYLPDYGWIDLEVTPGRAVPDRGASFSVQPAAGIGPFTSDLELDEGDLLFLENLEDLDALERAALAAALARARAQDASFISGSLIALVSVVGGVAGAVAVALVSWHVMHRNMPPAAQAYTKVLRAARLLGAGRPRWQTPAEFATSLGGLMPGMAESAALIALEYEQERYARGNPNSDADGLAGHWRKVLRGLIGYRARMIVGGGPRTAQDQRGA